MTNARTYIELVAPSYLANWLVNGDHGGLIYDDLSAATKFLRANGVEAWQCIGAEDAGIRRIHDASQWLPGIADCQTYTFIMTEEG